MKFSILFDKSIYLITILSFCLVLGCSALFLFGFGDLILGGIVFAVSGIPLIIVACFAPRYYMVWEDGIIIKKVVGKVILDKQDIENISIIDPSMLKSMVRKFGSGGFFGYYGFFYSKTLKNVTLYAGSGSKNMVLIKLKTEKSYIITPKEIGAFVNTVKGSFGEI